MRINLTSLVLAAIVLSLSACQSTGERSVPKTPEAYTISGSLTGMTAAEERVSSVKGEALRISIGSPDPDIVFDVYDRRSGEAIFIGAQSPRPSRWATGSASGETYRIRIYDAATDQGTSKPIPYTLEVTSSD